MDASPASGKDEFHSRLGTPFPHPPRYPRHRPDTGRQVNAGAEWCQRALCLLQALGFLPTLRSAASSLEPSPGPTGGSGMSMACARLIFQTVVTTKIGR